MNAYKVYFQRFTYDGATYTEGNVYETLAQWGYVCSECGTYPMKEMKELATLDWVGEDGQDVYVPTTPRLKSYDLPFSFIGEGADSTLRTNAKNMVDFLKGGRLAYYDEYSAIGRKDLVLTSYDPDVFIRETTNGISIISFKLNFRVYDPVTSVTAKFVNGTLNKLQWSS